MSYIEEKDKYQLLEDLGKTAQPGSMVHEQQKVAIAVHCVDEIRESIGTLKEQLEQTAQSSDHLSRKVFWLNVILTIATVVGAVATVVIATKT